MTTRMKLDTSAYEVIEKKRIEEVDAQAALLRHKKSGARVVLLSNADDNKTFYIGFRTPPKDSTGVAHIIEHSVLCGSEKYPVKDPFVELAKGSLNTFLNAMTFPDKTVYPVASCNDKDFRNLVDVYMDAVLHPNIYTNEKIFRQEGWHYELFEEDGELTINGVVYNEMKGVYSSPSDVLQREIQCALFPDNSYGVESGGDPDDIPKLTYEKFLEFHKTYYHPSNSYIFLYGDMDMDAYLEYLDTEYLSKYEQISVDSEIQDQADFADGKMHVIEKEYPVMVQSDLEDSTFLTYATAVASNLDPKLYIAFSVLEYALCGAPGAPVREALLKKGICSDIDCTYENGVKQSYFTIIAQDANYEDKDAFLQTILDTLKEQAENGIEEKSIRAALNMYEFRYREADFGNQPKGLIYGLQLFDSWLYDDLRPFEHLIANPTFDFLKAQVGTGYYEQLIREYLLESKRSAFLIMQPKEGLAEEKECQLAQELAAYKASLTKEECLALIAQTKELKEYQESGDTKEALATIPLLTREDMKEQARQIVCEEREEAGVQVLYHQLFTNGIAYVKFLFDMGSLPERLYPYAGLLKEVLSYIDTEHFSYLDFNNEMHLQTGGCAVTSFSYTHTKENSYKAFFAVQVKAFYDCLPDTFMLVKEMLMCSKLDDTLRLREIVSEIKSKMQQMFQEAGMSVALGRVKSYLNRTAYIDELMGGLDFYSFIEDIDAHFEEKKEEIVAGLREVAAMLFRPECMMFDYASEKKGYALIPYLMSSFVQELHAEPVNAGNVETPLEKKNEGLCTAGKVQYVVVGGNYLSEDRPYTGALLVLKNLLSYGYLWVNVRVKGGAYGAFCTFGKTGPSCFASYRDPKLQETLELYRALPSYIEHLEADEEELTKGIIGAIAELDTPLTPRSNAAISFANYMMGTTQEDLQKERDEILHVTLEDIRALAPYLKKIMDDQMLCVVGAESEITKCNDEFMSVRKLG